MNYIDVHSHFLPGIDDGAANMEASLAMAEIAIEEGVSHCVCTPHIQPGRFDNTLETIEAAYQSFKQALVDNGIQLQVAFAAECHFGLEIMSGVEQRNLPYLGTWEGNNVILLEFPHGFVPYGAEQLTGWLLKRNIIPMIAHPERNRGFIASPARLKPFVSQGCLLQVTTSSFLGRFGTSARLLAESLAKEDLVTVVGSDTHNTQSRPPLFREAASLLAKMMGETWVEKCFVENPTRLTSALFKSPAGLIN